MRVLITGAEGFTGQYMAAEMKSAGFEVHGFARDKCSSEYFDRTYHVDLLDESALNGFLFKIRPDYVIHLAAISFAAHGDVNAIYQTNLVGTRNLLEAIVALPLIPKAVLLASSANIYGNSLAGTLSENAVPNPANDYAVSKLAMEYMSRLYIDRLPIVLARPFNYTGVGQSNNFLLPKIVDHFRRRTSNIDLGNLDVARDFSDVRTVAECYRRLLESGASVGGIFNVCSGRTYSLADVMRIAESITGHSMEVRINPSFVRASDVRVLCGSRAKLEGVIGSVADYPLEETLRWMLEA